MKSFLFLLILFPLFSWGQTVTFTYDVAGNQITRVYNSTGNKQSSEPIKEFQDLTEKDLKKFFPNDIISYYPNPVRDELFIHWDLIDDNNVNLVEIYGVSGQCLKKVTSFNENSIILSFIDFPIGTYLVQINYVNGDQKSIKIIKN
ncbi:T9SS type A sorting domain-containing protein [Flavobacterium proteolyticum]|uniref:T9SS type A sorting domain-containing protein n=1 Tax=Flavobacterium proteolyticum TaxID=2911683 RepID=A0ABR9WUT2_9FLAO|nr:T9SS type A sorting domain-containing protein [Flavobacterium proteolyticum]MBE9577421.1 T9SS type A sorting domain-containing protein [Flavobacterium proteolyticum]